MAYKDPEKNREAQGRYRAKNLEKIREGARVFAKKKRDADPVAARLARNAYRAAHLEEARAQGLARYWADPGKHRAAVKKSNDLHKEEIRERRLQRRADNRDAINAQERERRRQKREATRAEREAARAAKKEASRLRANEKNKKRRHDQRAEVLAKEAAYRERRREELNAYARAWLKAHPGSSRAQWNRRRALKRDLLAFWTSEHWEFSKDYFGDCCAVCRAPLDGFFHTGAADHWISLNDTNCPGTVPWNMIPLCHGRFGCNNSKGDKNPTTWLVNIYGKRKAAVILKRVNKYFDIMRERFPIPDQVDASVTHDNQVSLPFAV